MIALFKVYKFLSVRRQLQIYLIFISIILSNLAELISIGAVIPLLAVLTDENMLVNFLEKNFNFFLDGVNFNKENLKFNIVILFVILTLNSGLFRIFAQWLISKYTFKVQTDISTKTFNSVINQSYSEHLKRNTSEVVSGISNKVALFKTSLYQFLNTISALGFTIILIVSVLLINFKAGSLIISLSTFLYFVIWFGCKKMISSSGNHISSASSKVTKILQEALGSIRDILIRSNQKFFTNIFFDAASMLNDANAKTWFISSSPRIILETLAMILISISALYFVDQSGDIINYIPFLGSLALAAQRFLPALNNIYTGASTILANDASVNDLIKLIELPRVESFTNVIDIVQYNYNIEFKDINFKYERDLGDVLKNINFKINKGDWIGIVGKTGSGKSTLVDILMGLLSPTSGQILIDGNPLSKQNIVNWQKHISHVPQDIFLSDLSIKENIAFGINENDIDLKKVKDVIKKCNLFDVVSKLPGQLNSRVGEKGVKLSGGQVQRIAIARALYSDPDLIVFDEATSGLDTITEKKIIDTINNIPKHITIIMISHNLDILTKCTKIINIANGKLKKYKQ